ncbi:uncharacterized protein LOC120350831 [Nilaparvata lugens]|uniref:uncharacterized protein LOC120350831 n=1 Tax=Nilaparvata lugens TaxID=108931 RepID=UPI00193CFA64|nr:uncharacterized protein LOC120350831 [Nilaparvata lugens]
MAGMCEVASSLEKHKKIIVRELKTSKILSLLVEKGVFSADEEDLVRNEQNECVKGDIFIDLISKKGVHAFEQFCFALELECPHILSELLSEDFGSPTKNGIDVDKDGEGSIRHIDSDAKESDSEDSPETTTHSSRSVGSHSSTHYA